VYSGWLEKRGKLNTAWKRRWCIAKNDQLLYYKTKDQRLDKPTGSVSLSQAVVKVCYTPHRLDLRVKYRSFKF